MDYLIAIVPSAGVLVLFVLAMRSMFQADRRERLAQAQWERAQAAPDAESAAEDHSPAPERRTPEPG